jgi:hypothetical protein
MRESYELAMYFMVGCFDKRGKRGYLFIIGDELAYPRVDPRQVAAVVGDRPGEQIGLETILAELRRRYVVYFIIPAGGYHSTDERLLRFWRDLLGERVIHLDDPGAVSDTIALTVGLAEEAIDLDEGLGHLREVGSDALASVSRALRPAPGDRAPAR